MTTAEQIERILREQLAVTHFELRDDSAKHAGHAGAVGGGGHYRITLVSPDFSGLSRIARHRAVYDALAGLVGGAIHALSMATWTPEEWEARQDEDN